MFGKKKCDVQKMAIWLTPQQVKSLYEGKILEIGKCNLFEKPVIIEIAPRKWG